MATIYEEAKRRLEIRLGELSLVASFGGEDVPDPEILSEQVRVWNDMLAELEEDYASNTFDKHYELLRREYTPTDEPIVQALAGGLS